MRTFGYIRVSKERDDMISPEIQKDEISRYCERKGWEVTEYFQDLDLSGRSWDRKKRKGLEELMARALAGECDAVVFYRIDRLSREEEDLHAMLAALQRAGVVCDSPGNPNDGSPESALLWSISAALAKYESVRLGARLRDAHAKLARMGRWSGGVVPYGWRRVRDEGGTRLEADPDEAKWRRGMHEQYHRGWSCIRIARYLNEHEVPTRRRKMWTDGIIWNMLRSAYQVGARSVDGELVMGGNVEPILSREIYERTLALMETRHRHRGRVGNRVIPGRLLRCGNCGGPLVAGAVGPSGALTGTYACLNRKQGACSAGVSIHTDILMEYVERRLFRHLRGAQASWSPERVESVTPIVEDLERARETLGRLALMRAEGKIEEDEFAAARSLQRKQQADLEVKFDRASRRLEGSAKAQTLAAVWEDLGALTMEAWQALSVQAKRDILDLVVDHIVVDPATGHNASRMPPDKRVRIRWR